MIIGRRRSLRPGSLVAWDGLGYAGKLFVYEGPRGAEIAAFTGRPAKEPSTRRTTC
jgi:uncharacterized membrane protein